MMNKLQFLTHESSQSDMQDLELCQNPTKAPIKTPRAPLTTRAVQPKKDPRPKPSAKHREWVKAAQAKGIEVKRGICIFHNLLRRGCKKKDACTDREGFKSIHACYCGSTEHIALDCAKLKQ
eukprot:823606_1